MIVLLVFSIICGFVNATSGSDIKGTFQGEENSDTDEMAYKVIGSVLTIVRISGVTTAVVILMVIGARYIIASAGDRADIKKYAVKYVIGALILFSASGLIGIIQNFTEQSLQN